jgi:hypothetical protein
MGDRASIVFPSRGKRRPRLGKRRTASASAASVKGPAKALSSLSAPGVSTPVAGRPTKRLRGGARRGFLHGDSLGLQ